MDPNQDFGKEAANTASQNASNMTASLPSVLNELKGNLNQIFSKDNPLIQERTGQLSNYLSAGDKARAEYLPTHSGFAFSPTELNAMVSARQGAALAPLATTNQMIVGQYGGLNDYLSNAKDLFSAKAQAAQMDANRLQQAYHDNLAEYYNKRDYEEKVREFDAQQKQKAGAGSGGVDIASLLSGLGQGQSSNPYAQFSPSQADMAQALADKSAMARAAQFDQAPDNTSAHPFKLPSVYNSDLLNFGKNALHSLSDFVTWKGIGKK